MVWQKLWLLLTTKETVFATETHVIYVRERVCLCSTAFIGFASQKKEAGLKSTSFSCGAPPAALYIWPPIDSLQNAPSAPERSGRQSCPNFFPFTSPFQTFKVR